VARFLAFVVLVALVAGGVYYWKSGRVAPEDLGALGRELGDTKTTAAVRAALELNRRLAPHAIHVSTEGGVVTLRGSVPDDETRSTALRVVSSVPGVRQVVDHLRPGAASAAPADSGRTLGESLDDRAIEAKLRVAFSLSQELEGATIEARAFRRQITLTGEVRSEAQRQAALETARDLPNVVGVSDELRVGHASEAGSGRAAVERALAANRNLGRYRIAVSEEGGRIVLRGRVSSGAEKDLAGLLARDAAGAPVENDIQVAPSR
jgi:osmotically-inducible protein OsmY